MKWKDLAQGHYISDDHLSLSQVEVTLPTTSMFLYFFAFFVNAHLGTGFEFNFFLFFKSKISCFTTGSCVGLESHFIIINYN